MDEERPLLRQPGAAWPDGNTLPRLMEAVLVQWEGQGRSFAPVRVSSSSPDRAAKPGAATWSRRSGTESAR